jgi:hypothetical protein
MRNIVLACAVALFSVPAAAQPEFTFTIGDGRVTLIADGVPARTILLEWARLGQSQIVNAEKVVGPPLTLRLVDVPEEQALDIVLRSASGYLAAPRAVAVSNASRFDRIMILASSRPTAAAPVPAPSFPQQTGFPQQPGFQQPMPQPGVMQPGMMPPGMMPPEPMDIQDDQVDDGTMPPPPPQELPVASPHPGPLQVAPPGPDDVGRPEVQPQPLPMTAPRPGLIAPAAQQPSPRPSPIKPPDSSPIR